MKMRIRPSIREATVTAPQGSVAAPHPRAYSLFDARGVCGIDRVDRHLEVHPAWAVIEQANNGRRLSGGPGRQESLGDHSSREGHCVGWARDPDREGVRSCPHLLRTDLDGGGSQGRVRNAEHPSVLGLELHGS